ncbi:MAG: mechanosensitive ion channel family protein [Ignavibacteria bacterium]
MTSVLIFIQAGTSVFAQTPVDSDSRAYVRLDGYNLFYVRGLTSFPAENRANEISGRIESLAKNSSISPDSIKVIQTKDYDEIVIGGFSIMKVLDADAQIEGVNRETYSFAIKLRIAKAIYAYRYERSYDSLIKNLLYSLAAVVICTLLLFLFRVILKRFNAFLEAKLKPKVDTIESRSFQLLRPNQIWITISGLIKVLRFILILVILFFTAQYVLGLFPWTRSIGVSLLELFVKPFGDFGIALINFIPNLAFLVVIFFIAKYLLKLIKLLFQGLGQGSITISGFDADWSPTTYKIVRLFLIAFTVIIAYPYIPGSDSAAFKGVSLFLGVLFSLGSTSIIGNLIAGYTMTYRKTFKIGDIVEIEGHVGKVFDVKLFVTRIRTHKNEEVIIPNSIVLNNKVINYSNFAPEKGLILHTSVGIGYETSWRLVESMLKLAAERTEGVLKDPQPFVLQKSLGDFAVTYEINAYTLDPVNRLKTYTALHQNILDVFNENDVQIMTPAYEGDPEQPKVVPKEKWFSKLTGQKSNDKGSSNPGLFPGS